MSKVEAAIAWARRGFPVFPCFPDEPGHPANADRAKRPVEKGWTEWATTDEALIRSLWSSNEFNIGCLTTNYLVVDVDTKAGKDGWGSWLALHGQNDTLSVRTPSGGFHFYYMGANVAINQGALGKGLDVRSHHGYTLAPGSTVNGVPYQLQHDQPLALAPAHIVARCKPPGERAENAQTALVQEDDAKALTLAQAAVAAADGAVQGELSEATYKLACTVRDYGVSEFTARQLMEPWGLRCVPPVFGEDLFGRIANAYLYAQNASGTKHPNVLFSGIVIPPVSEIPTAAAMPEGSLLGNAVRGEDTHVRPWVLKRLLLRREITALVAPGGVGKSLFEIMTAAFLAMGLDMFDFANASKQPINSIIYNAEDDLNEMSMRLDALCQCLGFPQELVRPRIAMISGKTHQKLKLVTGSAQQPTINVEAFGYLINQCRLADAGLLALDPLNKLHQLNGNDNIAMSFVMEQIEQMAEITNAAVLLAHHTSKPNFASTSSFSGNAGASQGASAVVDSARIMMTLMPPSDEDAARYEMSEVDRRWYLRLDDAKMNRSMATADTLWLHKRTIKMWSGEDVGGLERADMSERIERVRQSMAASLQTFMTGENGAGSLPVKQAAEALRSNNPLYEKMKVQTVQQRITAYFTEQVKTPSGHVFQVIEQPGGSHVLTMT